MDQSRYTGLRISRLGMGCASAWGQKWFPEESAISLFEAALDLGITVFDTGASYSGGNAEPRLGRALKGKSVEHLLISTKTGTHISANGRLYKDWSADGVFRQVNRSRKNLGLDTIPLLYLHGPRPRDITPELLDILREVRHRKWVRLFGVCTFEEAAAIETMCADPLFDVIMLDYNLLRLEREPLIEKLQAAGRMIMGGAALANQAHAPQFFLPKSKADVWYLLRALKNHRRAILRSRKLKFLRDIPGWSPAQIAIALAAENEKVSSCLFGTTRIEHLRANVEALSRPLPAEISRAIRVAMGS